MDPNERRRVYMEQIRHTADTALMSLSLASMASDPVAFGKDIDIGFESIHDLVQQYLDDWRPCAYLEAPEIKDILARVCAGVSHFLGRGGIPCVRCFEVRGHVDPWCAVAEIAEGFPRSAGAGSVVLGVGFAGSEDDAWRRCLANYLRTGGGVAPDELRASTADELVERLGAWEAKRRKAELQAANAHSKEG